MPIRESVLRPLSAPAILPLEERDVFSDSSLLIDEKDFKSGLAETRGGEFVPLPIPSLIPLEVAFIFTEGQKKLISAAKYLWNRWSNAPIHEDDIADKLAYDLLRWLVSAPETKVESDGTIEVSNEIDELV